MSRLAKLTLPAAAAVLLLGAGCVYHSVPPTSLPPYEQPISLYQARQIAFDYCVRHGEQRVSIVQAARVGPDRYRVLLVSHPQPFMTENLRVWVASTGGAVLDADFQRQGSYWMLGRPAHPSRPAWPAGRPYGTPVRGHPAQPLGRPVYGHPAAQPMQARPVSRPVEARPMARPAARPMPARPVVRPAPARPAARPAARPVPGHPVRGTVHPSHPGHPATPSKAEAEKAKKDAKKAHHGHAVHPAFGH